MTKTPSIDFFFVLYKYVKIVLYIHHQNKTSKPLKIRKSLVDLKISRKHILLRKSIANIVYPYPYV